MLLLCKVTTNGNLGTTYHLTDREFESMAALQTAMRKTPEKFTEGRYTVIDKRPVISFKPVTQFKLTIEG